MALPLFETLDSVLRDHLQQDHRVISIPSQHQLLFQEDWGEEIYILLTGLAKVRCLNPQGDERVLALLGSGALIGDLAALLPRPLRTADVVSLTPATLMKLRHGTFQEAMRTSPEFMRAMAFLQAQRLSALGHRLILMNEDATTRLLASLLLLARLNGPKDDLNQPIPAIPQNEIALIAGLSRGTTSTLLAKLRQNGTLVQSEEGLRFANLEPLRRRGLILEG